MVWNAQKPQTPIFIENIATFRRKQSPQEICIVPEIPQNRKNTDAAFVIVFGICLVVQLSLMIYALVNSDMRRFIHGYDTCGNICGSINSDIAGVNSCSGKDMTNKPFLQYVPTVMYDDYNDDYYIGYVPNQCVSKCNVSDEARFHRCFPAGANIEFFADTVGKIDDEAVDLTVLCIIGVVLSVATLFLFRYFVRQFVWAMLIISMLLLYALTGFFWYEYSVTTEDDGQESFLGLGILFTFVSILCTLCILVLTARIKLILFFFQEAVKAVFAMPLLLVEPVLTFITNFLVLAIFAYIFLLMSTSGSLQYDNENRRYMYVPNAAMSIALYWTVIVTLWMLFFVLACQQIVIAGAVATYYFARDKLLVVSPIYNSFYNLVRFHLGSAVFGAFTITVVTLLKYLIRGLSEQRGWLKLAYFCLRPIEDLVKYLTSMGYIVTAIHGQPLCRSSLRALNLIIANLLSAVAMNSIGNFVFFMGKLLVVVITVGIGLAMKSSAVTIVFGGFVAFMCIHCFFSVFEIAVDTIFICYCEDQSMNDGSVNPYYATVELHNMIKKAQVMALEQQKKKEKAKNKNK